MTVCFAVLSWYVANNDVRYTCYASNSPIFAISVSDIILL